MSSSQLSSNSLNLSTPQKKQNTNHNDHNTVKKSKNTQLELLNSTENNEVLTFPHHPALNLIGNKSIRLQEYRKFINLLYYGLTYCIKNLKGPSEQYLKKKSVTLPESQNDKSQLKSHSRKKFLMLDLDETLVHSVFDAGKQADVKLIHEGTEFRFNVRPHCLQFLDNVSEHYEVYVFTASTKDYAEPIVKYLNKKKKTIQGILHRKNCLETINGFKIKDLRIIANRPLSQIIIVDNLIHSFGLQLENGIPIIEFTSNKNDRELFHLQKILMEAKHYGDVRDYLKEKLHLKRCLQYTEKEFFNLSHEKWNNSKSGHQGSKTQRPIENREKYGLKGFLLCGA